MIEVRFYGIDQVDDAALVYAVICARYQGQWIFCKNKRRLWEVPGGRREVGETIMETAKRELWEETGAIDFVITPVCVYSVIKDEAEGIPGMLYLAQVAELEPLPETEIEAIDFFDDLPEELSFPEIQPHLHQYVKQYLANGPLG